jgi:integrase
MTAVEATAEPLLGRDVSHHEWAELSVRAPQLVVTMHRYLAQLATFLAPRSVDVADSTLRQLARWLIDSTDVTVVADITRSDIEDYKVWLAARPGTKSPTLAKNTQRQRLRMIRIFFERLIEWDWKDIEFFTYLDLAVTTGARRSQLLALRWADIDIGHAALGFSRALVEGPAGPVLRPTKNRRTYRVALDPASIDLLIEHRHRADERAQHLGGVTGDSFVFTDEPAGRQPWLPNRVTKRFITYRQRAGLAHFRLHDLRHFMATTMLAAGVPVPVVSERLCHARTSTTVNIYAHAMPGADRDAANLLADILNREHP